MMETRVFWRSLLGGLMALAVLFVVAVSPALADEAHEFNPQLSLTGGCIVYPLDTVPDPDCPYPAPPLGPQRFVLPTGIAIDSYGDVYVANRGKPEEGEGRIDIFDAEGHFISELPEPIGPRRLAVDSEGHLYVYACDCGGTGEPTLLRYDPVVYDPPARQIEYDPSPTVIAENVSSFATPAVNPENDHLFINFGAPFNGAGAIEEFGSVAELAPGEEVNELIDANVAEVHEPVKPGLAIDAAHDRLYATHEEGSGGPVVVKVFDLAAPHDPIETITGSTTPEGSFVSGTLSLAADEETGHLFVYEQLLAKKIWELTEDGQFVSSIEHGFESRNQQVAVDNGPLSPNGGESENGRYLWATSAQSQTEGHAFAFGPRSECPPEIDAVSFGDVAGNEVELRATINPCELPTSYRFEYVSKQQFDATGFEGAQLAGQGTIPAGKVPVEVFAEAVGLAPGTSYVFRVLATNALASAADEGEFSTYPSISQASCPNDELRVGPSLALPDCRAYELVTPAETNARAPSGLGKVGAYFWSLPASPAGDKMSFRIEGGLIPGSEGTGSLAGDPYLASRGSSGWSTVGTGGTGAEARAVLPGGRSPDQTYNVWVASGSGPAVLEGDTTVYVRYPDGHSELLGQGSLEDDPHAQPKLITENGQHMIFISSKHLEDNSPPSGSSALYDRTSDGTTRVVSLLSDGSGATDLAYAGASFDGQGIAFTSHQRLYFRYNNAQTYDVGDNLTFEGIAEGGKRIFYLEEGDILAFDVSAGTIPFATSGDATVVNVSADGSTAYFESPSKLTGVPNPLGEKAGIGANNLYVSREGIISFIGRLTMLDVKGKQPSGGGEPTDGLGLWSSAVGEEGGTTPGRFGADPSRSTADGRALLFQAQASLTDYDTEGYPQVYRYDPVEGTLKCLSCNPTGAAPTGAGTLQSVATSIESPNPNTAYDVVDNLSADGRRAVFQSEDPLVAVDTNGLQDVYEWEAQGVGSCTSPDGCVYLLSSGHSAKTSYLYAASASGNDVFIWTAYLLLPSDIDETPSIYDARVEGGFPEIIAGECQGEGCRPNLSAPPLLATPGMSTGPNGNLKKTRCPRGRRKVKRHGKVRCVKKHSKHRHHHHASRKGAGK